jgi:hypothetical protein
MSEITLTDLLQNKWLIRFENERLNPKTVLIFQTSIKYLAQIDSVAAMGNKVGRDSGSAWLKITVSI